MKTTIPAVRPARPYFSCGPASKRPGWSFENLQNAALGRSVDDGDTPIIQPKQKGLLEGLF